MAFFICQSCFSFSFTLALCMVSYCEEPRICFAQCVCVCICVYIYTHTYLGKRLLSFEAVHHLKPHWVKSNLTSTIQLPPPEVSLSFLGRVVWDVKTRKCLWKLSKPYISLLNFECSSPSWDWDQNNCLVFMTDWIPVTLNLNRDLVTNGKQLND